MSTKPFFLGIDTSAYTTSVAVVDEGGLCLSDERRLLDVKDGERGLRQSEAFFQHVNHFPERLEQALTNAGHPKLSAIAVSAAPRDVEGSYMPVFQAGVRLAENLSVVLGIPLYKTTHQDGHIMAGCQTHPVLLERPFLAVHLSGGTTEILNCRFLGTGFRAELIGGTKDLSFGQLIDRIGVHLGMPFPAGKALEALILESEATQTLKPCTFPKVKPASWFNLSGLENKAYSLMEDGALPADLAAGMLDCLAKTLLGAVQSLNNDQELNLSAIQDVLVIGGVASNLRLRAALEQGLNAMQPPMKARYASVADSSDNAVGVALIARACYHQGSPNSGQFPIE